MNNNFNELNEYGEKFNNMNFSRKKISYKKKNLTYEKSKNNKIDFVNMLYIKLFGRQFILLGETHMYRHSENLINYSNLIKLPIKLSKKNKKCIDVYIEEYIYNKQIINNDEYKLNKVKPKKKNVSLGKLIYNLTNREKYQMHKYYRLHSFDTRENSIIKDNNKKVTKIYYLFEEMEFYFYKFNNFIKKIFKENITHEDIKNAILNLLIDYCDYIDKDNYAYRIQRNIKKNENIFNYITRKHKIDIDYMTNYFFNFVSRIYKEYNKVPLKFKEKDISPLKLFESLEHKDLFMTDMYLFYRLLMNFSTNKRNTGECKNYSEKSFVIGGAYHTENIGRLLKHYYDENIEKIAFISSFSINKYQSFLEKEIFN